MSMNGSLDVRTSTILCAMLFATSTGVATAQTAVPGTESANPATAEGLDGELVEPTEDMAESGDMVEPEEMARPVEGQITMQSDDTVLASVLMGASVYSPTDESVGDISDMIVNLDGTIEGVVIDVGGFLGIGEKAVAVEMTQLSISMGAEEEPRLVLGATREDLEAAPAFVTMEEQRDAAEAARIEAEMEASEAEMQSNLPAAEQGAAGSMADPLADPVVDPVVDPETDPATVTTGQ